LVHGLELFLFWGVFAFITKNKCWVVLTQLWVKNGQTKPLG